MAFYSSVMVFRKAPALLLLLFIIIIISIIIIIIIKKPISVTLSHQGLSGALDTNSVETCDECLDVKKF